MSRWNLVLKGEKVERDWQLVGFSKLLSATASQITRTLQVLIVERWWWWCWLRWQQWWWWWRWLRWQRWWWWRWWTAVLHLSLIELRQLVYKLSIVILFYTLLFWNNQKCFIPKFDCSILHPASPLNSQAQFNPDIFPQNEAKYRTCFGASSAFIRILTLRAFLYHGCTLSIHISVVCFIPISWLYF